MIRCGRRRLGRSSPRGPFLSLAMGCPYIVYKVDLLTVIIGSIRHAWSQRSPNASG